MFHVLRASLPMWITISPTATPYCTTISPQRNTTIVITIYIWIELMKNNSHSSLQSTQTQKAVRRTFKFISVQLHLFWSPLGQWPTAGITLVSMTPSLLFFDLSFFEMLWVRSGLYSWNKICYVLYNSSWRTAELTKGKYHKHKHINKTFDCRTFFFLLRSQELNSD